MTSSINLQEVKSRDLWDEQSNQPSAHRPNLVQGVADFPVQVLGVALLSCPLKSLQSPAKDAFQLGICFRCLSDQMQKEIVQKRFGHGSAQCLAAESAKAQRLVAGAPEVISYKF